ncbi:MAG: hypothetical protein ACFFG0_27040 [Candidatus Thorarchaeota archaeon]
MSDLLINELKDFNQKIEIIKLKNSEYNSLKSYNNKIYTGMAIGGIHQWNYTDGKWYEMKKAPNRWTFSFNSIKTRLHAAPSNTGAHVGTKYHWYIMADQIATKLDTNSYMTQMKGVKFKIGHKRPHWKTFSYNYPEQQSYKERLISTLEYILRQLTQTR